MRRLRMCAVLALVVMLSGCNDSSDVAQVPKSSTGTPPAPTTPPPPPPPTSSLPWQPCTDASSDRSDRIEGLPTGYWAGTLTDDVRQTTDPFWLIVAPDGRFRGKTYDYYVYYDPEIQWVGALDPDSDVLQASASVFSDVTWDGKTAWRTSNLAADLSFDAGFNDVGTLVGDWEDSTGNLGCFELEYFPSYGDTSLLGDMTGVWTAYGPGSKPLMTFTVDTDGSFNAQDIFGCASTGQVALLDQDLGLFDVQTTMSGCPLAGSYSGLATLGYIFYPERVVAIYMDNGTEGLQVTLDD